MTTRETTPAKRRRSSRVNRELGLSLGEPLSRRDREVLRALMAGHVTAKAIGLALSIAERTVRVHLCRIYEKAGAINQTDLVLMAVGRKASAVSLTDKRPGRPLP